MKVNAITELTPDCGSLIVRCDHDLSVAPYDILESGALFHLALRNCSPI